MLNYNTDFRRTAWIAAVLVATTACRSGLFGSGSDVTPSPGEPVGSVTIRGSNAMHHGTLRLERAEGGGVRLSGMLVGVPAGPHGLHIHAVGRCDAPDFTSAGAHLNAEGRQHGLRNPAGPHAGDAPNVVANTGGRAPVDVVFPYASVPAGTASTLRDADGSSVVLHARADDQISDPAGDSGDRIACGVVQFP